MGFITYAELIDFISLIVIIINGIMFVVFNILILAFAIIKFVIDFISKHK